MRPVDAYRNKMRSTIIQNATSSPDHLETDAVHVEPHFETRVGKRRWRDRRAKREAESEQ